MWLQDFFKTKNILICLNKKFPKFALKKNDTYNFNYNFIYLKNIHIYFVYIFYFTSKR